MPNTDFIDMNHNDMDPQFHALQADGVQGMILKTSEGATFKDPFFQGGINRVNITGMHPGAYHFLGLTPAQDQVDNMLSQIKDMGPLVLALDYERTNKGKGPFPPVLILQQMVQLLVTQFGKAPLLYTNGEGFNLIADHGAGVIADCPIWFAKPGKHEPVAPAWANAEMVLWQWSFGETDHVMVAGFGPYDLNAYTGSLDSDVFWANNVVSI